MGCPYGDISKDGLATRINTATRNEHTKLNRSIIARLPLGLPPTSFDPLGYATGIAAFAEIFFAFEQEWQHMISRTTHSAQDRTLPLLSTLYHPDLLRTQRLKSDISTLNHRLNFSISPTTSDPRLHATCTQLSQSIRTSIRHKPHTILAYTWVMYMALFSGGRWMRQELLNAGPSFWKVPPLTFDEDYGCLSLFFFPSDTNDGLDIKSSFKATFEHIAMQLDEQQKTDIIDEAIRIFQMCSALITSLDEALTTPIPVPKMLQSEAAIITPPATHHGEPGKSFTPDHLLTRWSRFILGSCLGGVVLLWLWSLMGGRVEGDFGGGRSLLIGDW